MTEIEIQDEVQKMTARVAQLNVLSDQLRTTETMIENIDVDGNSIEIGVVIGMNKQRLTILDKDFKNSVKDFLVDYRGRILEEMNKL